MKKFNEEIKPKTCAFLFAGIILLAVVMRLVGISWGMPYSNLHPDEGIVFYPAYQCALDRTIDVHGSYYRPNHVTIKASALIYMGIQDFYFAPRGMNDFAANYSEHFALFTTSSRIFVALLGVGVVIWTFLIGLFWGRKQALFAALLAAVFPGFIEHSHYITPDIPLLFFLMGAMWAALHYQKAPSVKWLFWMSLFTSFAICEKYPGAYGCLIIAVAVISAHTRDIKTIIIRGLLAVLFVVLGILAVSPALITDLKTVLDVMAGQNGDSHIGGDGLNHPQIFVYYLENAAERMGLVLVLCSIYGVVRSFMKKTKQTILLSLLLIYLIPISMLNLHWERYDLPVYEAGVTFGAFGSLYLLEDIRKRIKSRSVISSAALIIFVLLPIGNLFAGSVAMDARFLAPDSRIVCKDDIDAMGLTLDNTACDCNTPLDPGGFYGAWGCYEGCDPSKYKWGPAPKFVMTSSGMRDLFLEGNQDMYGWIANFYRRLDEEYPMIYIYTPENPSFHVLEVQNIYCAARTVVRYLRGTASGCELRVYVMHP
ncbi:MAG: glycosyltransferase family 39 protein [Lachnospiraceae bacterium]|nr:glycosyltransferase family 39 protein [Lachnospiraceae bacterium]